MCGDQRVPHPPQVQVIGRQVAVAIAAEAHHRQGDAVAVVGNSDQVVELALVETRGDEADALAALVIEPTGGPFELMATQPEPLILSL